MKDKKLLLIILIMVLIVSIGKETYALFTDEVSSIAQSYSTGTLKLSYSNTSVNLDNAYPLTDKEGTNQNENTITITNVGTLAYKFNVIIDPSGDSTISSDLIRVSIDGEKPATLSTDSNIIIRDVILNPGSSRIFTIKLWISGDASSSDVLNKKFSASLTSTGIAVKDMEDSDGTVLIGEYTGTLYNYIRNNADTTVQIDFSKTSEESNTNGIYMTANTDSGKPVYYYRGNVDNHLIFANFCWKIIRTTETGGVKLIYDGVPTDGMCNNTEDTAVVGGLAFNPTYNDAKYVGYMYGSSIDDTANTNNSKIKKAIDTAIESWLNNDMTGYVYMSQLEDTVFCNDRSYIFYDSHLIFGSFARLYADKQPTLKCQNARDKFTVDASNGNGALTYPVGLITADEVAYAGGAYQTTNSSFYLYTGKEYWTLSPAAFYNSYAVESYLNSSGSLEPIDVSNSFGVRIVVSLKPGIEMVGGTGTATDPFVLAEPTSLYNEIKKNVDTTTQIDFSKTSATSNTNGIYMTTDTDSGNPVYYYRGNVDNHLIFADFCWRIVRTTETGGVKLIYDGMPTDGMCNNTGANTIIGNSAFNSSYDNAKYVGYMYGDSIGDTANTNNSKIKTAIDTSIDTWFKGNITKYAAKLEDTVFCNDRSYTSSGTLYFGAYTRLYTNKTPTLKCQNAKDKFTVSTSNGNGALTYPVGLITADEVAYAGSSYGSSNANTSFYLYTGSGFWTLSPAVSSSYAGGLYLNPGGYLNALHVNDSTGIRSSVSLKPGTILSSGSGTAEDPYIVE